MTKKKTNKRTRPLSQVSSQARAQAKITAEALTPSQGGSSLEAISTGLELPSWVQGLILPAVKDLKLGSLKDMRAQENVRLDALLLGLTKHALGWNNLRAIDRHLKISKARRELWRLDRQQGDVEPNQTGCMMSDEMQERVREKRRLERLAARAAEEDP